MLNQGGYNLKNYEGLFLVKPELEKEKLTTLYQQIEEVIKKHNGQIESVEDQGKKRLSYEIKKYKEAIFYIAKIQISPDKVSSLTGDLKLIDSVLRVMITQ